MFFISWFHLDRSSPVCSFYFTRTEFWRGEKRGAEGKGGGHNCTPLVEI